MNAELPQSYFELAASRRADLERSIATERSIAAGRRTLGRGAPRHAGRRRSLVAAAVGAIAMLSGFTVYALDDAGATRSPSPATPAQTPADRSTVCRPHPFQPHPFQPHPFQPRPLEAPLAV